jgi:hypothetical protein
MLMLSRTEFGLTAAMIFSTLGNAAMITPDAYDEARRTARRARQMFADLMADTDVILTPSAPGAAPHGLGSTGKPTFNRLWTLLGPPCINVPGLADRSGLPLGMQIVGRFARDRVALGSGVLGGAGAARLRPRTKVSANRLRIVGIDFPMQFKMPLRCLKYRSHYHVVMDYVQNFGSKYRVGSACVTIFNTRWELLAVQYICEFCFQPALLVFAKFKQAEHSVDLTCGQHAGGTPSSPLLAQFCWVRQVRSPMPVSPGGASATSLQHRSGPAPVSAISGYCAWGYSAAVRAPGS